MKIILIISCLLGIYKGLSEIQQTEKGYLKGVRPSNSLLEFIFLNR
jgi:hypothetical protein